MAWVMPASRFSTRCMVANPIGPIRTIAASAENSTQTTSELAVALTKAMASSASSIRYSR